MSSINQIFKSINENLNFRAVLSTDICRIFLSLSVLCSALFYTDYSTLLDDSFGIYPKGIINLFYFFLGDNISYLFIFKYLGFVAAIFSLLGFFSNLSFRLMSISAIILSSLFYTFQEGSSHQFNVLNLALIPMCFSNFGYFLSLDKYFFKKDISVYDNFNYTYPIALAQFLMSWTFFAAFTYKLFIVSGFSWVFSDNLRNILGLEMAMWGSHSPLGEFISNNVFLYKSSAFMNLSLQGLIVFGCLFFKKPYFRLFFGFLFILEAFLLYAIMGLFPSVLPFNIDWILLSCFFIDWDYFLKNRISFNKIQVLQSKQSLKISFFSILILFNCSITYLMMGRDNPLFYPFSSTSMYSYTLSKKPYNEHRSFESFGGISYFINDVYISPNSNFGSKLYPGSYSYNFNTPTKIEAMLSKQKKLIDKSDVLTVSQSLFQIPAYPNPSKANILFSEKVASIDSNGIVKYFMIKFDKKNNLINISSKNLPQNYSVRFLKRKILYDYKVTLRKKHSKVIKKYDNPIELITEKISNSTYKVLDQLEDNYLISAEITYNDKTTETYRGTLIDNE